MPVYVRYNGWYGYFWTNENKVGIEETSEVLNNYLERRERQITRLYAYAKQLRCEKAVRTYLEVLL